MNLMLRRDACLLQSEAAFSVCAHCVYRPDYGKYLREIAKPAANGELQAFICLAEGEISGILVLRPAEDGAEIEGIAVSPACRNRGVGRYMILQAIQQADLRRLTAETDDASVDFYRKCGFGIARKIRKFPDGEAIRYLCTFENN